MDNKPEALNLTMLMDFYELTMANGYFENGYKDRIAVFDMFFRTVPDNGGFAIFAGLEQVIKYIKAIKFTDDDIKYLESFGILSKGFLDYLKNFKFECDVWAFEEGTPMFPGEPIVKVRGPIIQAQMIETMILLTINHQSLIATKTNRMVRAAQGRPIMEFGSRRAQGSDAAIIGARAAFIGGCVGTACTQAGRDFGMAALGTMAHSWVQMFESEYEAFKAYAILYPNNCTLLIDTYNVIKSGIVNAIKVFDEVLKPMGARPKGVRIDSGDIAYLSKKLRKILDDAGYEDCLICASNALDEYIIRDLFIQGAKVDSFGIGENLITSKSSPVFGGVYKLSAIVDDNGKYIPKIKVSESVTKITNPDFKEVYRLYENETGRPIGDYICLSDESIDESKPLTIFDPNAVWKQSTLNNFTARKMLVPIFEKGECVYTSPKLTEIREHCQKEVNDLWEEVRRFDNPHRYYVDLSTKLKSNFYKFSRTDNIASPFYFCITIGFFQSNIIGATCG